MTLAQGPAPLGDLRRRPAVVTAWTESEVVWVFLAGGVVGAARDGAAPCRPRRRRSRLASRLARHRAPRRRDRPTRSGASGGYFAEAGAFVFGSGLAIVPFLHGGVVDDFHWLTERQFLDAVAVAMITPGPGRHHGRPSSAISSRDRSARPLAALGVFLPCYLFVVIPGAVLPPLRSNNPRSRRSSTA